jgi:hypothetical protein
MLALAHAAEIASKYDKEHRVFGQWKNFLNCEPREPRENDPKELLVLGLSS